MHTQAEQLEYGTFRVAFNMGLTCDINFPSTKMYLWQIFILYCSHVKASGNIIDSVYQLI